MAMCVDDGGNTLANCGNIPAFIARTETASAPASLAKKAQRRGASIEGDFRMETDAPLLVSQLIVRVCLCLAAAIAMFGGALQMILGQPETSPRLDNVHRFMAGIYFSTGVICLWAAVTVREQRMLVYLLALGVLLGGLGRLVSIYKVGFPKPIAVWLAYLVPELVLPFVIAFAHAATPLAGTR